MKFIFQTLTIIGLLLGHALADLISLKPDQAGGTTFISQSSPSKDPSRVLFSYCHLPTQTKSPYPIFTKLMTPSHFNGNGCSLMLGGRSFDRNSLRQLKNVAKRGYKTSYWTNEVGVFLSAITAFKKVKKVVRFGSKVLEGGRTVFKLVKILLKNRNKVLYLPAAVDVARTPKLLAETAKGLSKWARTKYFAQKYGPKATSFGVTLIGSGMVAHSLISGVDDFQYQLGVSLSKEHWKNMESFLRLTQVSALDFEDDILNHWNTFYESIGGKNNPYGIEYYDIDEPNTFLKILEGLVNEVDESYFVHLDRFRQNIQVKEIIVDEGVFVTDRFSGEELRHHINYLFSHAESKITKGALGDTHFLNGEFAWNASFFSEASMSESITQNLTSLAQQLEDQNLWSPPQQDLVRNIPIDRIFKSFQSKLKQISKNDLAETIEIDFRFVDALMKRSVNFPTPNSNNFYSKVGNESQHPPLSSVAHLDYRLKMRINLTLENTLVVPLICDTNVYLEEDRFKSFFKVQNCQAIDHYSELLAQEYNSSDLNLLQRAVKLRNTVLPLINAKKALYFTNF